MPIPSGAQRGWQDPCHRLGHVGAVATRITDEVSRELDAALKR
jgi:hypothetical protein